MAKNIPLRGSTSSGAKPPAPNQAAGVDTSSNESVNVVTGESGTTTDPAVRGQDASPAGPAEQILGNASVDGDTRTVPDGAPPTVSVGPAPTGEKLTAEKLDCRVLSAVTLFGVRFEPNDVLEGVPEKVATQHVGSLDPHPDAVAFARAEGYPVKRFA